MRVLRLIAALLLLGASAWATDGTDQRIAEADNLLGDAASYPRAIALYREVLEETPDAISLRHKLARVLSWDRNFDASLEEYDRLVGEGGVETARIERAEVLSWAARFDESEAAFRALLEEDPRDARAARGVARVLSWSGRRNKAARAYEEALSIEEDEPAREEWQRLLEGYRPALSSRTSYLVDSDQGKDARYPGNYLNWIYYHATVAQRDALPPFTRIQVAKTVVADVIDRTDNVRFGMFEFDYSNGGKKVSDLGDSKSDRHCGAQGYRG